jgi:type VI secretion system secreted protein Hcp
MSDILILDLGAVKGNCTIDKYADKIIVSSFSHSAYLPMGSDAGNTERTLGRPVLSEMSFSKPSDLATTELFKSCTQGTKLGPATLNIGRVENGVYMNFMMYVAVVVFRTIRFRLISPRLLRHSRSSSPIRLPKGMVRGLGIWGQ